MAPGKAESDFGLQGWIDTLGLKQIFLIFSAYPELREVKLVTLKMFFFFILSQNRDLWMYGAYLNYSYLAF